MRAKEQKHRAALLSNAQDRLDGQLGIEVVARFVGQEIDDLLLRRIAKVATAKLVEESTAFEPLIVTATRVEKLVMLTARFRTGR